jgi:hypothetical protein
LSLPLSVRLQPSAANKADLWALLTPISARRSFKRYCPSACSADAAASKRHDASGAIMTTMNRADFYLARQNQELVAASRATHPESRRIHQRLAEAYADLAAAELPMEIQSITIRA